MRTESWAPQLGPHARLPLVVACVALVVLLTGTAMAAGQPVDGTPWRDADRAAEDLAAAQLRVLDARDALVVAEAEFQAMLAESRAADEATFVMASELQATQDLAVDLAVEAYISGGTLTDALYILDATTANDFAYRTTLITEGADAVARSSIDYLDRREQATDEALVLADEIEQMDRTLELAREEITKAELSLARAEWAMEIAEIHRAAEELLSSKGRTDPTPEQWKALRFCESTENYDANTGNSFYGAYQFTVTTWIDMGGKGLPSDAPPEEQDARARYLYALRGSGYNAGGSWPLCGRHLPGG